MGPQLSTVAKRSLVTVAFLLSSPLAGAECIPQRMVKVVYVSMGPEIDKTSFEAQPKTLYRYGSKYGRVERVPDAANGIHGLMVVNEPDVWMVNLVNKEGKHLVDTAGAFQFRAPLFTDADGSTFLTSLEFGCEVAYVKATGATGPNTVRLAGQNLDQYDVTRGVESIIVLAEPGTEIPYAIAFYRNGSTLFAIRYIEYSNTLPPEETLFERPGGINFTDATQNRRR